MIPNNKTRLPLESCRVLLLADRQVNCLVQFLMTTVTLDRVLDQDTIVNQPKDFIQEILESACSATRNFLRQCKNIWEAKQLPKSEWMEIKQLLGWSSHTANSYSKIWQWISDLKINSYNLELLDINTIKSLCSDKYLDVWYQIQSSRMVVDDVRSMMADINKSLKVVNEPPKALEWEKDKHGDRRLVIRLEDPDTGAEIEKQFKESGKLTVSMFLIELLRRPTVDEQVLAQQELNTYIDEQIPELPDDIKADIAKEDRITELTASLRKVNKAIDLLIDDGHEDNSYPLISAREGKDAIVMELRTYGVIPHERTNNGRMRSPHE